MLTSAQLSTFHTNGYLILESVVPSSVVDRLQEEGNQLLKNLSEKDGTNWKQVLQSRGCIVEPLQSCFDDSITTEAVTNKQKYRELRALVSSGASEILDFILGDLMKSMESLLCTSSRKVYLLNEQFIMKHPSPKDTKFEYHQDREYFAHQNVPYVSCWTALDDMSEDNGCLYIVPYPKKLAKNGEFGSPQEWIEHHEMQASFYKSKEHYQQNQEDNIDDHKEIPILVPKGSLVILACTVLHRSGSNLSGKIRRAFMPQYSTDIIYGENGKPVGWGIPL